MVRNNLLVFKRASAGREVIGYLKSWHSRVPVEDEFDDSTGGMCRCLGDGGGPKRCRYLWLTELWDWRVHGKEMPE